jgi:hypothetical protein
MEAGCAVQNNCRNAPDNCWKCKFDRCNLLACPGVWDNEYNPIVKTIKHPQILAEKESLKKASATARKNRNPQKMRIQAGAAKAEAVVKESLNSGRTYSDGDLTSEDLCIDVKKQIALSPHIKMSDWDKVQADAVRTKKKYGVLIIKNATDEAFVVMPESLFKEKFL